MVARRVEAAIRALDAEGRRILVAVSGGVDSTVLLASLLEVSGPLRLTLAVGHVHHGLRGAEADADLLAVRASAEKLGLDCLTDRVDPRSLREDRTNRERPTVQEAARELRYLALDRMGDEWGADHVATAHTLDDQAETVLMRLLRGTSPDGLGGIPERSPDGRLIRPLLGVSREDIEQYARQRGLAWREDASNASDAYTRNRIRNHWLPALAHEFNPQLLRMLGNLAEAHRRDAEWMAALVDSVAPSWWKIRSVPGAEGGEWIELVAEGWSALPESLARRLMARALTEMGGARDLSRTHLQRTLDFVRDAKALETGKRLELPGGLVLRKQRTVFLLERVGSAQE